MTMANYTRNALLLLSTKVQQIWKPGIFQHLESKCLRKEFFMPALNFSHDIWQNILCWMALQRNRMLCLGINWFLEVIGVLLNSKNILSTNHWSKIELNFHNSKAQFGSNRESFDPGSIWLHKSDTLWILYVAENRTRDTFYLREVHSFVKKSVMSRYKWQESIDVTTNLILALTSY